MCFEYFNCIFYFTHFISYFLLKYIFKKYNRKMVSGTYILIYTENQIKKL